MAVNLSNRLVVGLASSALFDLTESDQVFKQQGEQQYRSFQSKHQNDPLKPGVAFSFIQRLLSLNQLDQENPPVEVVLLSKNDPDTGLRVMNSIEHYGLDISRAVFLQGQTPYQYIPAFNIELFLSANAKDVEMAVNNGLPAGQILPSAQQQKSMSEDPQLRIAFDFDGVLADDEAEVIYQKNKDLDEFHQHETNNELVPHNPGPLKEFLSRLAHIQNLELIRQQNDKGYQPIIRISIVTARSAPSHKRVINTMRSWGIIANEAFFMGGVEKSGVLKQMQPHIFFDDQKLHLEGASEHLPSVHIPFGITNKAKKSSQ